MPNLGEAVCQSHQSSHRNADLMENDVTHVQKTERAGASGLAGLSKTPHQVRRSVGAASPLEKRRPSSAAVNRMNSAAVNKLRSDRQSQKSIGHLISKTIESTIQQKKEAFDEQKLRSVWRAFGSYIAKQLIGGKGVLVPKFGHFTFTATEVSLAGTTNPQDRDRQLREPVFMIGKDFVSAVNLRTGISHNQGSQVRPIDLKGTSGIIPKVKINYVEVGQLCNTSKDECRSVCEKIFRDLSDKARQGEQITAEIPLVGRFLTRANIAAIDFLQDLVESTRGNTAKQYIVGNLFSSSNAALNLNIHDGSKQMFIPQYTKSGAISVQHNAQSWLKKNLDIDIDDLAHPYDDVEGEKSKNITARSLNQGVEQMIRSGSQKLMKDQAVLSTACLDAFNRGAKINARSKSNFSRPSSAAATHTTAMASHMSVLPELTPTQVMSVARSILESRAKIIEVLRKSSSRTTLRSTISSTQIYQILKRNGFYVELGHLKVLLRELGLPFNGPSTSFTVLFTAVKAFLREDTAQRSDVTPSQFSALITSKPGDLRQMKADRLLCRLRDLMYLSKRNLYDIFKIGTGAGTLDQDGFRRIVGEVAGSGFEEEDIDAVFQNISKRGGKVTFQVFEETFRSEEPTSKEFETVVIRKVRDWMFKNRLSSEMAFDALCRAAGRFIDKTLTRAQFMKAMQASDVGVSSVQIDALFSVLTPDAASDLSLNMWQARIYEDGDNPLQMIRETILQNQLTQDDVLFQLKLRVWDKPLDSAAFFTALRNLDQTLSDIQIRSLFVQLKNDDGKVCVPDLIRNFTGQPFETADYRNQIFKKLYAEIYPNREEQLIALFEEEDTLNNGLVSSASLLKVLSAFCQAVSKEELERFVRFLEKDKLGRVNYMEFLSKTCRTSNKNHNPFKSVVSRLSFFLKQNNISAGALLKRLAQVGERQYLTAAPGILAIPLNTFAEFLKQKVEKKRSLQELLEHAGRIDVDKDGLVTEADILTCIKNLGNAAFFKDGGAVLNVSTFNASNRFYPQSSKLSKEKALAVCKQIREALAVKKLQYRDAFDRFDQDKDGMVSYAEFSRGLATILDLSNPVKEQLYALMDKHSAGLISYDQFLDVLRQENIERANIEDNFDWETNTLAKIRSWVRSQALTVEEAFKCFDKDFDGFISKTDLKDSLIELLEIDASEIQATKLDRLFRLLDFFKSGVVQVGDFQHLMENGNPYRDTMVPGASLNIKKSLGGGLTNTSTFDWKFSVVQQIGLVLSRKFPSCEASFEAASNGLGKIRLPEFKTFLEKEEAINGFNLTSTLIQKLFCELDPHKKGFLNVNDWKNALKTFNWSDQLLVELKQQVASTFRDWESIFTFMMNFGAQEAGKTCSAITYPMLEKSVTALTSGRFKKAEIQTLWKSLAGTNSEIDKYLFRKHFEGMTYRGCSSVKKQSTGNAAKQQSIGEKGTLSPGRRARATIQTTTASSAQWESNILERLRVILAASPKTLEEVFAEIDTDGNGYVTAVEFRNAVRKLGLGLTSREIDQVMALVDTNQDGCIDYQEFSAKFKPSFVSTRMQTRTANRMARLKELMILHMTSPSDAFRFFDVDQNGTLTFSDFVRLVEKVQAMAKETPLTFPVVKDIFDTIDVRKDGLIDQHEWQQTFGRLESANCSNVTFRTTELSAWENTRECAQITQLMAKNRKLLAENFKQILGAGKRHFTFAQGKQALDSWLYTHFNGTVTDGQLKCLLRPALVGGEEGDQMYDYVRLLEVNKSRHVGSQL